MHKFRLGEYMTRMNEKKEIYIWEDLMGVGGIETFFMNLFRTLDMSNYTIHLIPVCKITNVFDEELISMGIDTIPLLNEFVKNPIKRFCLGLISFGKFLRNNNVQTVHFMVSHCIDFLYIGIAKRYRVTKRISHAENAHVDKLFKFVGHYILKPFVQKYPTIRLACSEKAGRWVYTKRYYTKCTIVHNAILPEKYSFNKVARNAKREELGLGDLFTVVHIGRINPQKNHEKVITVFDEIRSRVNDCVLLIVGDGKDDQKEKIVSMVIERGLQQKVRFLGNRTDIKEIMWAADCMLFPSLFEGLPLVLIEAQAASLPCVVSDTIDMDVKTSDSLIFVGLDQSDEYWAERVLSVNNDRCERIEDIRKAGYDMHYENEKVLDIWKE